MEDALTVVAVKTDVVHVDVDIDVLDPAYANSETAGLVGITPPTGVIVFFFLLTLVFTYRLIRMHYPQWVAVCITFGLGINAWFLQLSNSLLTDVPFLLGLVMAVVAWVSVVVLHEGARYAGGGWLLGGLLLYVIYRRGQDKPLRRPAPSRTDTARTGTGPASGRRSGVNETGR